MTTAAAVAQPATWRQALRLCASPRSLRSTLAVALVVGTVLFAINQLDTVLAGRATGRVWLKAALTYVVPFLVANYGLLVGARHRRADQGKQAAPAAELPRRGGSDLDTAADFELPDHHGRPWRLGEHLAGGPVLLVFYRGDW